MRTILLLTILVSAIPTTGHAFENEPDGFRGIKWGSDFAQYRGAMYQVERNSKSQYYSRRGDKMALGAANLTGIYYEFWKNKFASVLLKTEGSANKEALIMAFKARFGTSTKSKPHIDQYFWVGPVSSVAIICKPVVNTCTTLLMSTTLRQQQKKEDQEAAEAAGKDF